MLTSESRRDGMRYLGPTHAAAPRLNGTLGDWKTWDFIDFIPGYRITPLRGSSNESSVSIHAIRGGRTLPTVT